MPRLETRPAISIGMPVYNVEPFVASAVTSLLDQSFSDFELIISDNASTDATLEICQRLASNDERIRILRQDRNVGVTVNYATVAQQARAPLFKWATGSDLVHRDFLKACVAVLNKRPDCVLCFPQTQLFQDCVEKGTTYKENLDLQMDDPAERFRALILGLRLANILNGLVRRHALAKAGFMPDFMRADVLVLAKLSLSGKFVEIPEPMFFRRMDTSTASVLHTRDEVRRRYYPTSKPFSAWRLHAGLLSALYQEKMTMHQRLRAAEIILKHAYWNRREFLLDIREAAQAKIGLTRSST